MIVYYNKLDQNKEPINKTSRYNTIPEATNYFCKLKRLKMSDFVKIFKVEKHKKQ